jgi:hypothetical protein
VESRLAERYDIMRQVTERVSEPTRRDSLLSHCLARAVVAAEGREKLEEQLATGDVKVTAWMGVKATPKASRVAAFIVLWAAGMRAQGAEEFSITEYQRHWNEGERQAYRLQKEFRDLWPEFETPNELARQIARDLGEKDVTRREVASLPATLQVTA